MSVSEAEPLRDSAVSTWVHLFVGHQEDVCSLDPGFDAVYAGDADGQLLLSLIGLWQVFPCLHKSCWLNPAIFLHQGRKRDLVIEVEHSLLVVANSDLHGQ